MKSSAPAIRSAVRIWLEKLEAGDLVLVAISGGTDSLSLAYALSLEAPKLAIQIHAVTVDHQLQPGSGKQAEAVVSQMKLLGIETTIEKVTVDITEGLEASARKARYAALDAIGNKVNAVAIFLGHTRDDQAESVLLGLARGSGTRSLSGMAAQNGKYIRPLLSITRIQTESVCNEFNLDPWNDPHNSDSSFARVRVRREAIPTLEKTIGPGISEALARSAQLLRDDADALDGWAEREIGQLDLADLDCEYLSGLPQAIRSRIIREAIFAAGAPSGSISADHVSLVEALVTSWSGQGASDLPGGVKVERFSGRLSLLRN
ncbi:MAG: tRNA lysidine(34) synthetase TilS [Actinobacteria bacterium]|nr:tRNA lysidine(34) synthetase TilS [Actinomycetota bacterium]MSW62369.1 tRNA lysidine(34) synthetase TilS [Actinomycetota bacterium]MSX89448.1 tRNA lysidine(34) synthetase TilS [Actinomycetota bacterium]MTA57781.1 tRNA lysidine(34) synthetase TilS [Actinomycetota bacterium]